MDVDDPKEQVVLPKAAPEVPISEVLEKDSLDESGASNLHKGSSPDVGLDKPVTDAAPTVVPASSKGKEADEFDVVVTETRQGVPPAQNFLAKVIDDKRQV